ncbi:putative mitochondrial hypothetical protein [Leptomonas pyrrhocoris]|uniref:Uncharacterized protein n=1 Tax=Leptomonas pyrrhocoris TaxID=157538 RepID=A0A0M9FRQ7_LEPPY|nr:putative mitochondrial hypothetical protein [Leptomonas pyrrhocoris]XP_015653144.1 putative mitochondrial hypothetical protein [Leptomonas pyrrhocoris]KPA74704.1 putative mitochondrial hypothetical protein [Leptomonas pyrrhocoris]KPA74705.1 putative mitochondrial hypothetical protein [Leptomonas pyrrhocoris]|eukprot:XP_015653143.1 putative mitochondrial hypothetical protein [Leptomonas pyrrhocoris]
MLRTTATRLVWLGGSAASPALGLDLRSPAGQFVNVIPEGTQPRRTAGHFHATPQARSLAATHFAHSPELRHIADGISMSATGQRVPLAKPAITKWSRQLRADVYDELLKLPLRYALHDFRTLQAHLRAVPEVAPADEASDDPPLPPGVYRSSHNSVNNGHSQSGNTADPSSSSSSSSSSPLMSSHYAVAGRDSAVGYAPPLGHADPLDVLPFFVHRTSNGQLPGKVYSMNSKTLMPAFYMRIMNVDGDVFRFEEELMKIFPTKKIFVRSHSVYVYNVNLDGRAVLHHWLLGLGF